MRVLKFGGTSLANRSRIVHVSRLVLAAAAEARVVVVASAMAGVTNTLENMTQMAGEVGVDWTEELNSLECRHLEVLAGLPASSRLPAVAVVRSRIRALRADVDALAENPLDSLEVCDRILAVGERLSVQLLAATLQDQGCAARPVDGADLVATDSNFGEARVDFARTGNRCHRLLEGRDTAIPVVTGFVGGDLQGRTTTLGRGGSDFSAAVLGAVLEAERVEIWTDVDGVLTGPPNRVPNASSIRRLSYEEAEELAFFGAEVLHPKTVRPLADRGIPINVRNTLAPKRPGTEISSRSETGSRVVAVSALEEVTAMRVRACAGCPDEALMACRASSDGVMFLAVPTRQVEAVIEKLARQAGPSLEHQFPASIIALVGHDIALQPWAAGRALESLARRGIRVRSLSAGPCTDTVALLVDRNDLGGGLCAIHDGLTLGRQPSAGSSCGSELDTGEVEHGAAA